MSDQGGTGGNIGKYLSTLRGPVSKSPLVVNVLFNAGVQILPLFQSAQHIDEDLCTITFPNKDDILFN